MSMLSTAGQLLRGIVAALTFLVFITLIGHFSWRPTYQRFAADHAMLTVSFSHAAERTTACERLTPAQIAALPPQERRPLDCSRERWPLFLQVWLDEQLVYATDAPAAGIARDGVATVYENLTVAAGRYELRAELRDTGRETGFDHQRTAAIELQAGHRFVIDFRIDQGGFIFGTH